MRYALVVNGVVENVVEWDGVGDLFSESIPVEVSPGVSVGIGWSYDGASFVAPPDAHSPL